MCPTHGENRFQDIQACDSCFRSEALITGKRMAAAIVELLDLGNDGKAAGRRIEAPQELNLPRCSSAMS
jgi:hypothetical protein